MALQITGKIKSIGSVQSIPSKNGGSTFDKRELVLDTTRFDPYTGERSEYENYPCLEFSGEKCKDLDGYQVGQVVTVSFELQGSFYKGQDGIEKNITRARAFKIEARGAAHQPSASQQPAVAQPQPQAYQAPTTRYVPPPPSNDGLPW
jgi:hypothetical protein